MTTPRTPTARETIRTVVNDTPLTVAQLCQHVLAVTSGWPKRVGDGLYVRHPNGELERLKDADHLMAYLDEYADLHWHRGGISLKLLYAGLGRHAPRYDWATAAVHYPPLDGVLYLTDPPPPMATGYLDRLVDRFRPDTPHDRALIKAAFMTPAAGVPAGRRPGFLIVAGQQHAAGPDRGRGCGKTSLADAAGLVHGGVFQMDSSDNPRQVRSDLLSPGGMGKVVLLLDNLKSNRYSSEFVEKLVTGHEIGGHVLYQGEGKRPNHTTLFITVNGANLSKDLAKRVVMIRLAGGEYSATWWADTERLIRDHRTEILADIGWHLTHVPAVPLAELTRHPEWCLLVVARLDDPDRLIDLIRQRQGEIDDDDRSAEDVVDYFEAKLQAAVGSERIDDKRYFIPNGVAQQWLKELGSRYQSGHVKHHLDQIAHPRLQDHRLSGSRGCVWVGVNCPADAGLSHLPSSGQSFRGRL